MLSISQGQGRVCLNKLEHTLPKNWEAGLEEVGLQWRFVFFHRREDPPFVAVLSSFLGSNRVSNLDVFVEGCVCSSREESNPLEGPEEKPVDCVGVDYMDGLGDAARVAAAEEKSTQVRSLV